MEKALGFSATWLYIPARWLGAAKFTRAVGASGG